MYHPSANGNRVEKFFICIHLFWIRFGMFSLSHIYSSLKYLYYFFIIRADITTLSIDSGDIDTVARYAKTGLITDATTNPLFVSQAGANGDARYEVCRLYDIISFMHIIMCSYLSS